MNNVLLKKVNFIKELNAVITKYKSSIESIEYRVYETEDGYTQEYLVITYDGGAMTVRNCNGNSISAIVEELAKYLDSGYYDEVRDLKEFENDPIWFRAA